MEQATLRGVLNTNQNPPSPTTQADQPPNSSGAPASQSNHSDNLAAIIIGLFLVIDMVVLSRIALTVWFTSDCSSWWPPLFRTLHLPCPEELAPEVLADFKRLVVSGCMAGLGGAVYLLQRFSVTYAYGYKDKKGNTLYLQRQEVPHYLLIALSCVILGPITIALARAGAITFTGFAPGRPMPMFTLVGLSFVLGFTYHDTLKALARLSKKYLGKEKDDDSLQLSNEKGKREDSAESANAKAAGA
jgi:hypothetical protein